MLKFNKPFPFYCYQLSTLATPSTIAKRFHQTAKSNTDASPLPQRGPYQRDRDRIIHSVAFRRLKHKTQVFIAPKGDHYRTRLTHSLEVAQIARSLARLFGLDEDLTEAIALAHDMGHTPFGHTGEIALDKILRQWQTESNRPETPTLPETQAIYNHLGFDHNDQSLRIVMQLEKRYADFRGLNLTDQTLLGIAKHNGGFKKSSTLPPMVALLQQWGADLTSQASLEGQIAALADDIAYNAHDLDDGYRSGIMHFDLIMSSDFLKKIITAVADTINIKLTRQLNQEQHLLLISYAVRQLIKIMTNDLYQTTLQNILKLPEFHWSLVLAHQTPLVSFSKELNLELQKLKKFLGQELYFCKKLQPQRHWAEKIVTELFQHFMQDLEWLANYPDDLTRAAEVRDYIAGMTDVFALKTYQEITHCNLEDLPFSPYRFL